MRFDYTGMSWFILITGLKYWHQTCTIHTYKQTYIHPERQLALLKSQQRQTFCLDIYRPTQTHTHTQTHRHTDTQPHRHTDTQTHKHTHTHTPQIKLAKVLRFTPRKYKEPLKRIIWNSFIFQNKYIYSFSLPNLQAHSPWCRLPP